MGRLLRISLLGTVAFQLDDQPLSSLTWVKARALLIYLAVTGRPHPRSALAGLLWSDLAESAAHNNLRVVLATMRQAVGDYIAATRQTIALATGVANAPSIWLDVAQFVQACTHLQTADAASMEEGEYQALRAAVYLYKGDFLAGFYVPDAELFDEWMSGERAYYGRLILEALTWLAEIALQRRATASGIEDAQRALTFDPLLEKAHQLLMQLYAHSGQSSQALRQYDECVRLLNEELGIAPSEETVALYEAIRTRTLPKLAPSFVEGSSTQSQLPLSQPEIGRRPRHNLPHQTTPFFGRTAELAALAELLVGPERRLVTIVAPGGMGKTRLAQEAALAQLGHFADGVYFVPLAPLSRADEMAPTIADAVNYPMQAGSRSPQEQLIDFLRPKQMLLVLDNFEHLLDGAAFIISILEAASEVKLLVTSRERLRLTSESLLTLSGLQLPTGPTADFIPASDAVHLFVHHAHQVEPSFSLNENNGAAVAKICHLIFGMPLGIVLAAAWVSLLAVDEIAAEITKSLDFLEADLRDLPERQRSLVLVFEHTWQRLLPGERDAFMRLCVFRNGFSRQASQEVAGASTKLLLGLADKALIQSGAPGRFEVHELLRQYGLRMLASVGEAENAHDAHSRYFLDFLDTREADLKGRRQLAALAEIEAELDNIRAAWSWALVNEEHTGMESGVEAFYLYFVLRGRSHEGAQLLWRAYQALSAEGMETLRWRVLVRYCLVMMESARDLSLDELDHLLRFALAEAEASDNDFEVALCWFARGHQEKYAGDKRLPPTYDIARGHLEKALVRLRVLNDNFYMARVARAMSSCYGYDIATLEQNQAYNVVGLESARRAGSVVDQVNILGALGWGAVDFGLYAEAQRYFGEATALLNALVSPHTVSSVISGLAFIDFSQGHMETAGKMADEALSIAREFNSSERESMALFILGLVAAINGNLAEAIEYGEQSLQLVPGRYFRMHTLWTLALIQCGLHNHDLSWHYLRASHRSSQVHSSIPRILAVAAVLLGEAGEGQRAAELLGSVMHDRHSAHGWMEQWRPLTDLRAHLQSKLDPATFRHLWERGSALDTAALANALLDPTP